MHNDHHHADSTAIEYVKFALVLCGIITVSYLLYRSNQAYVFDDWLRHFMGVFLVVFALFKLAGYRMFVEMFPMYDLIAKQTALYAKAFPFIELSLGLLYVLDTAEMVRLIATIVVMGIGAAGILKTVYLERRKIHCACLGNIIRLPLSTVSLFEDVSMVAMAAWMLTL